MLTEVSITIAVVNFIVKMTTASVVEMSVNIYMNSPSQDAINLDDLHLQTCDDSPMFKQFSYFIVKVEH